MKLYIREDGAIQKARGFPDVYSTSDPIPLKRGDSAKLEIQFLDRVGRPKKKADTAYVAVALKEKDKFDGSLVSFGSTSDSGAVKPNDDGGFYTFNIDTDTEEIDTLLKVNADASDDVTFVDVGFEVAVSESAVRRDGSLYPIRRMRL